MRRAFTSLALAIALPAAMFIGAGAAFAASQPTTTDIKKHETTPGAQYEPSLDVLQGAETEAPGVKEGVPSLSDEEFGRANKTYFERCAGCHGVRSSREKTI